MSEYALTKPAEADLFEIFLFGMAAIIGSPRTPGCPNSLAARHGSLENCAALAYVGASFRKSAILGVQNAAVTASINANDGRANALVRRESALGLTERLT
jgi:hypothetical protein